VVSSIVTSLFGVSELEAPIAELDELVVGHCHEDLSLVANTLHWSTLASLFDDDPLLRRADDVYRR